MVVEADSMVSSKLINTKCFPNQPILLIHIPKSKEVIK